MGGGACFFGFKAAKSGALAGHRSFEGDPAPRSTTNAGRGWGMQNSLYLLYLRMMVPPSSVIVPVPMTVTFASFTSAVPFAA